MPPKQNKSSSLAWIVAIVLGAGLFFSLLINAGLLVGLSMKAPGGLRHGERPSDEFPELTEEWSYGYGETKVVRIAVSGVITRQGETGFLGTTHDKIEAILRQIRSASNDADVRAILLEVDSPGGAITPSDEIYRALMDFKESQAGRKIVVFMRDLAASGGYYVAMAGDWLIAEPTAVVGSIGVIIHSLNMKLLSDKIGLTDVTIKSGENKDLLNPFRDVRPEEIAILQDMIDSMYEHFLSIVVDGRSMDASILRPLADGRVFTAKDAEELELIDEIGYWDQAVAKTADLLGVDDIKVVRYQQRVDILSLLMAKAPTIQWPTHWLDAQTPQFMYLWRP